MSWIVALSLLAACDSGPAPVVEPPPPSAPLALSPAEMQAASQVALVPSPLELQHALNRAGIADSLGWRIKPRAVLPEGADADRVAVRTGVVLADLMLTAGTADAPATSARIGQVRGGLATLGAKDDLLKTLDELDNRVINGAVAADALVKELDELAGTLIPKAEVQLGGRVVPLIRAGSWVEGTNLVAGAMIEAGQYEAATGLLRQPAVVSYFRGYVDTEGSALAPTDTLPKLQAALVTLDGVCQKEQLGEAEVRVIHETTSSVLELL